MCVLVCVRVFIFVALCCSCTCWVVVEFVLFSFAVLCLLFFSSLHFFVLSLQLFVLFVALLLRLPLCT